MIKYPVPKITDLTYIDSIHFKAMRSTTPDHIRQEILHHIRNPDTPGTAEIFEHFITSPPKVIRNTTYFAGEIIYPTNKKQKNLILKHK